MPSESMMRPAIPPSVLSTISLSASWNMVWVGAYHLDPGVGRSLLSDPPQMRARAGDAPRNMTQKVLAPRAKGGSLDAEHVEVDVDQVALVRAPAQALGAAVAAGLKKTSVEVAVAY